MAARGATRAQPVTEPDDDDEMPGGVLTLGEDGEDPEYDVLFRLREIGDDGKRGELVEYEVLTNPPASMLLAYWDKLRKSGANLAFSWVLERMLRGSAYTVLLNDPAVSRADFRAVVRAVLDILVNAEQESPVPKSRKAGSRRAGG